MCENDEPLCPVEEALIKVSTGEEDKEDKEN